MTKPQILDILQLMSALESWAFSTGKPLPDYLLTQIDASIEALRADILGD